MVGTFSNQKLDVVFSRKRTSEIFLGLVVTFVVACGWPAVESRAGGVAVVNPGFEDLSGQSVVNEFTFGEPAGWDFHDPNNVTPDGGTFTGTLEPNGIDFFNGPAPEGIKVGILFNSGIEGDGEYGYVQTLAETRQADMAYVLTVEVGNIASGTAQNGAFSTWTSFRVTGLSCLRGER